MNSAGNAYFKGSLEPIKYWKIDRLQDGVFIPSWVVIAQFQGKVSFPAGGFNQVLVLSDDVRKYIGYKDDYLGLLEDGTIFVYSPQEFHDTFLLEDEEVKKDADFLGQFGISMVPDEANLDDLVIEDNGVVTAKINKKTQDALMRIGLMTVIKEAIEQFENDQESMG